MPCPLQSRFPPSTSRPDPQPVAPYLGLLALLTLALWALQPAVAQGQEPSEPAELLAALQSESESVREEAALELAETAPPEALPLLIRALREDPSSAVRGAAAEALGGYGPAAQAARPALEKAREDDEERVREVVTAALEKIRGSAPES